jgi:hypothetical protein
LAPTGKAGFAAGAAAASPENLLNRRRHCSNDVVPSDGSTFSDPGVAAGGGITRLLAADSDPTAANGRRALGLLAATAGVAIDRIRSGQQRAATINADGGCWRLMWKNSIRNRGRTDRKRSEIYIGRRIKKCSSESNVAAAACAAPASGATASGGFRSPAGSLGRWM